MTSKTISSASDLFHLGTSLTIPEVTEVLDRIRAHLARGQGICLQGGDLEQVDGAGVQLLCVLAKEAGSQDRHLEWDGISPPLRAAVAQMGLSRTLRW